MLTFISGVPGSGKTLLALSELVLPFVGKTIKQRNDDGVEVEHPRTIYTNVKGLQVDHVLVEDGPGWVSEGKGADGKQKWAQGEGHRLGFHNWHEWAKPGSIIVVDEFQKTWPPRPNGSPVPPDVQGLDTHRHMGVDFVLISQKFSFDQHLMGLIGRHLHVRRIANMPMAIVYEWDMCSRSLQFSKAISKRPWRYDKKVFKLYHSADLHTKQPRKLPALLFVVLAAIGAASWFIPQTYQRIAGKTDTAKAALVEAKKRESEGGRASVAPHVPPPATAPALVQVATTAVSLVPAAPVYVGCIASKTACRCYDAQGVLAMLELDQCRAAAERVVSLVDLGRSGAGSAAPGRPDTRGPVPPHKDTAESVSEAAAPGPVMVPPPAGVPVATRPASSAV